MTLRLLFDAGEARIGLDDAAADGPIVDLPSCLARLEVGREALHQLAIDDIIGLFDQAARNWMSSSHPVAGIIGRYGMGFLSLWMRRDNLCQLTDLNCHGNRMALDKASYLPADQRRLFRAQPRGLIVHWIAGNVAVLGMISLLQGLLTKNANLIKASSDAAGLLPFLLAHIAKTSWKNAAGTLVDGRTITDAVMVVYADRSDLVEARGLSSAADVRVAWGGRTAVEAIMNLPRRFGTEDVIFGPKLSFGVIGREYLVDQSTAEKVATLAARDCVANDQAGCNSPHTIFVETGGSMTPEAFAPILGRALDAADRRTPLTRVEPAAVMKVLTKRVEYDMEGFTYSSQGMGWTVLFGDHEKGLGDPCYLRTLYVRPIDDIFSIADFCSSKTQTAGLALAPERRIALAERLTARGIDRCPELGAMALYDNPWDGMFPLSRFVRWVSIAPGDAINQPGTANTLT